MTDSFFDSPQGAARLKLGVLGRYLAVFSSKTASTSPGGRVCYFDAYAGQGFYGDGTPGSPAVAASAVSVFKTKVPALQGFLVEKDPDRFESLEALAADGGWSGWELRCGEASDFVDPVLAWAATSPLFAFIDPFALPVPYEQLLQLLGRRGTTELLLNVSKSGIRRFSGHLTGKEHAARQSFISKMDTALGGPWWQAIVLENEANDSTAQLIADAFAEKLRADSGYGSYTIPAKDRVGGPTVYNLVLFTKHPDGLWFFNNAVSMTMEEERKLNAGLQQELISPDSLLVDEVAGALRRNLDEVVGREMRHVLGKVLEGTLGLAREKHIRAALKQLKQEGLIVEVGTGDLSKFKLRRPA